jgi:hypothetical protein
MKFHNQTGFNLCNSFRVRHLEKVTSYSKNQAHRGADSRENLCFLKMNSRNTLALKDL